MFRQGKIIRKFKAINGREIVLRYPKMGDVEALLKFINRLVAEPNIGIAKTKKSTRKGEVNWLNGNINAMKEGKLRMVVAEADGKIIGEAEIRVGQDTSAHVANFGIAIAKEYRNIGLGTEVMKTIFEEAKKIGMKIIILKVFSFNSHAIKTYESIGFKPFGVLPKGIYKYKKYADEIYMYKNI
jgi:RimJ/RimL family protein N-acetyltransferase